MRKLLTAPLTNLALVALLAGSASATGMYTPVPETHNLNPALQGQLERDAASNDSRLRRSPLGQVIGRGATESSEASHQMMDMSDDHTRAARNN